MKKIFTFAIALASAMASFAQADFTVGENVAAKLGLGDVDGYSFSGDVSANSDENRPHDKVVETLGNFWKVDGDKPNEFLESYDGKRGLYGFYDKKEADIYQVVKFPAGSYTVDVQALYREGTPQDNFQNHFNKKYMKYGHLYADCLTSEDPASTVTRNFDKVLCSLATANQTEEIYNYGDGSWMNDYKFEYKDKETGETTYYYCPQCCVGLGEYFEAGKYHNTMRIVVTEDTYIRLGFRKTGYITADWLCFTNLQVIYNGPADDAAKLELAKEEAAAATSNLEDVMNDISAAGFEALAGAITDFLMESDYEDLTSVDDVVKLKNEIISMTDNYANCLQFVKNLADLLNSSETMLITTEFPGIDAFTAALKTAQGDAATSDVEKLGTDPSVYYQGVYDALSTARADYLNSQEKNEKGAKDFTALVTTPWFVNPEYTPTQNDDGTWTLKEETWGWGSVGNPQGYNSAKSGRTDISSDVVLHPSGDVTNAWYKKNAYSGWSAGVGLFYQSGLIGVCDGWNSISAGTIGVEQKLVGLPVGYYSLKALVRGNFWAGDNPVRHAYAANSSGEVVVSETVKNDGDRNVANGWWEWNPNAWADVETSIIEAKDGILTIGGGCTGVADFTGFRLYFYGTELDFTSKLQENIDRIQDPDTKEFVGVTFPGDVKAIQDILDQIQFPITGKDAYDVAYKTFNEAKEIYEKAKSEEAKYNALETIQDYAEESYVAPFFEQAITFGTQEGDTYEGIADMNSLAATYKSYAQLVAKTKGVNNATLSDLIAQQTSALSAEVATEETLKEYMTAIKLPLNKAIIEAKGTDYPVNITELITNPDFTDAPTTGWSGETPTNNEYAFGPDGKKQNAELWNKSAFTLSQVLEALPAGTYTLKVKAIYRDGGAVNADLVNAYNEAGSEENWANHNALLIANDASSYIKAIESLQYTETSFTEVGTAWDTEELEDGTSIAIPTKGIAIEGTEITLNTEAITTQAEGSYPFDTKVDFEDVSYYYPSSMQGFYQICQKHPEDVTNEVTITIGEGEDLKIGIQKTAAIGSDWVIFDDFELYYTAGGATEEVTIADITTMIDKYLDGDATVTIADITAMIDKYLAQ